MEEKRLPAFASANYTLKLAIARDLQGTWADTLDEPIPAELEKLIERLERLTAEQRTQGRSSP